MSATKTFTPPLPSPTPPHTNRRSPVETSTESGTGMSSQSSTLIEFPGRSPRPQWRKELSLRVREIQERRAREGGQDFITAEYGTPSPRASNGATSLPSDAENPDGKPSSLGLVPSTPPPPVNPIVARALERIERARQKSPHQPATTANLHIAQTVHPAVPETEALTLNSDHDTPNADLQNTDAAPSSDIPERDELTKSFLNFSSDTAEQTTPEEAVRTEAIVASSSSTSDEIVASEIVASKTVSPDVAAVIVHDAEESNTASESATKQFSPSANGTPTDVHKHLTAHLNVPVQPSPSNAPTAQTSSAQFAAARAANPVAAVAPLSTNTVDAATVSEVPKRAPRRVVEGVIDEATLARREREAFQTEETARRNSLDDRALLTSRILASIIDCVIVGFLLSPGVATVELAYGNWTDARVWYVIMSAAALMMFIYSSAATAFAGRTAGQRMLSVKPVEVSTGLSPSVSQAIKRAAFWVISFAALGLGLLYALLDNERRGIHDHLSGTIVVSE